MAISLGKAELIGLLIETLCFGILSVMFVITLWLFRRRSKRGHSYKLLGFVLCTMFVLAAMHWAIDAVRTVHAFTATHDANKTLSDFGDAGYLARSVVYTVQVAVGDAFLVYRMYLVWGRDLVVILIPVTLWLACLVTGGGIIYTLASFNPGNIPAFLSLIKPWKVSYFALLITLNVACTLFIAYRIWRTQSQLGARGFSSTPVVIVIESGAIYSATVIILLIEQSLGGNLYYSCLDPATSIIGIVFSMIIIRVNMSTSRNVYPSDLKSGHVSMDLRTPTLKIQPMAFSSRKTTKELETMQDTQSV